MIAKKVLIPAAGLGTRFYPFTKAVPKELLPIWSIPVIDYVLREAFDAGLTDVVSVVSSSKKSFEDHVELLVRSKGGGMTIFVRQPEQKGLGHAVWCAHGCYSSEFVPVMLPDNIFVDGPAPFTPMLLLAKERGASIVAVGEVPEDQVEKYGIAAVGEEKSADVFELKEVVEKPARGKAPSNLAIVGRYILHPNIFGCLDKTARGIGGEHQLTDAIQLLVESGLPVYAYKVKSKFLDVGTPAGWLETILAIVSKDEQLRDVIRRACV